MNNFFLIEWHIGSKKHGITEPQNGLGQKVDIFLMLGAQS